MENKIKPPRLVEARHCDKHKRLIEKWREPQNMAYKGVQNHMREAVNRKDACHCWMALYFRIGKPEKANHHQAQPQYWKMRPVAVVVMLSVVDQVKIEQIQVREQGPGYSCSYKIISCDSIFFYPKLAIF